VRKERAAENLQAGGGQHNIEKAAQCVSLKMFEIERLHRDGGGLRSIRCAASLALALRPRSVMRVVFIPFLPEKVKGPGGEPDPLCLGRPEGTAVTTSNSVHRPLSFRIGFQRSLTSQHVPVAGGSTPSTHPKPAGSNSP